MALWGISDADESKPKWLTDADKKKVYADASGWRFENPKSGATDEVLCAVSGLAVSLGSADITDIEFVTTAFDKSEGGAISVLVRFNEPVAVTGTPQLTVVNDQRANHVLNYASGTGSNELTFTINLGANNAATSAGDVLSIGSNAMGLNSGTVKDNGTSTNATITNSGAIGTAAGTITVAA